MKRKFGRNKDHRELMLANLVTSLILYENIKTTKPKAKEASSLLDKMITLAKSGTLANRRYLLGYLKDKNAVKKLYDDFVVRFKGRKSGFAKIYKLGHRVGDGAPMTIIRIIKDEKSLTATTEEQSKTQKATSENINKEKTAVKPLKSVQTKRKHE